MDEPFGALDPLTRDALGEDYRRLHDELGLTTVMITHDMLEALLLADRIAVIRDGRIVADGTPHDADERRAGRLRPRADGDAAPPGRAAARAARRGERRHEPADSPKRWRGCRPISAAMSRSA